MIAHFTQWKGHLVFLDVVERLVREGRPVAALVVGGSIYETDGHQEYEHEVRTRCQTLRLTKHVVFTGYQACVADYLNAADILVHPPTRPEPFGLGVIEAMALGKPVVAAAAGGILETVASGATGLLVPPADSDAFTQAVRSLLDNSRGRKEMGERGRERVGQLFTPGLHVSRVERVYQEMMS
jgi:glycosyltransferase involved in cell wall biosynthesis